MGMHSLSLQPQFPLGLSYPQEGKRFNQADGHELEKAFLTVS